jgi:hypothetical protein
MTWGKRPSSRGRGPINWKKDAETFAVPVGKIRRHTHEEDVPLEKQELYAAHMVPGAMWEVMKDLELVKLGPNVVQPPFPLLQVHIPRTWDPTYDPNKSTVARAKAIALYVDSVRVDEQGKQGTLRVVRHTFIVGGGRYIITDLNWVRPIDD